MTTENSSQERVAAELLLAVAIKERDEAQARIDWLTALVGRYAPPPGVNGSTSEPSLFDRGASTAEAADDDDDEAGGPLYGKVRPAVHKVFLEALPRKLTMKDATIRFERLGIAITAKNATSSVRHAVKALIKQGKLKKIGSFHYKAVTDS